MLPGLAILEGNGLKYLHADIQGSTRMVTDQAGNILEKIEYTPYGKPKLTAGITKILYNGKRYSWSTGLYYYGARYYDPETARFTTPDKALHPYKIQELNSYVYCADNPIKYTDPEGKTIGPLKDKWKTIFWVILGALLFLSLALAWVGIPMGWPALIGVVSSVAIYFLMAKLTHEDIDWKHATLIAVMGFISGFLCGSGLYGSLVRFGRFQIWSGFTKSNAVALDAIANSILSSIEEYTSTGDIVKALITGLLTGLATAAGFKVGDFLSKLGIPEKMQFEHMSGAKPFRFKAFKDTILGRVHMPKVEAALTHFFRHGVGEELLKGIWDIFNEVSELGG